MAHQKTIGVCQISDANGVPIASAAAIVPNGHSGAIVGGGNAIESILSSVFQVARETLTHLLQEGESLDLARCIVCRDSQEVDLIVQYRKQKKLESQKSASKLVRKISKL